MKYAILAVATALAISGCATKSGSPMTFTYEYDVPGIDQERLWVRARNHFAELYGDIRAVMRVEDRQEALLLGQGSARWMLFLTECNTDYYIRFQSRNDYARLQMQIIPEARSNACAGYDIPTSSAYDGITSMFDSISEGLETSLIEGTPFPDM